jgi:hypothetical protein
MRMEKGSRDESNDHTSGVQAPEVRKYTSSKHVGTNICCLYRRYLLISSYDARTCWAVRPFGTGSISV